MPENILIADGDCIARANLGGLLSAAGYHVRCVDCGDKAIETFEQGEYDLLILEVSLSCVDGWAVCAEIRRNSSVPIIFVTSRVRIEDKVFAFDLGADDYVTKPFDIRELIQRIHVIFRRVNQGSKHIPEITMGNLAINDLAHEVYIQEKVIPLSLKEYEILKFMALHKGQALTREQIFESIWGMDHYSGMRTVDTHIWRLRAKLGSSGVRIHTVRGRGYKLTSLNQNRADYAVK